MQLCDIDWANWEPKERATILFIVRDGQILLIRKKRGLGEGKVNGPGGRIEPGETPLQGAVREVQEELLVTPTGVKDAGLLRFEFVDGFSMSVYVFVASGCEGDAKETDEAIPMWTSIDEIPYGEMWPDDAHWLPLMLEGRRFNGWFLLDDDVLLDYRIRSHRRGWVGMAIAMFATAGLSAGMWLCRLGSGGTLGWSECLLISGLALAATWLTAYLCVLRS